MHSIKITQKHYKLSGYREELVDTAEGLWWLKVPIAWQAIN
jgi:hypothetical protein